MQLTKEEAIRRHRMMWNWIAEETLKRKMAVGKPDAFKHFKWNLCRYGGNWCCEYVVSNNKKCSECPLVWPDNKCSGDKISPYTKWCCEYDYNYELCAKYAKQIAELPERKD